MFDCDDEVGRPDGAGTGLGEVFTRDSLAGELALEEHDVVRAAAVLNVGDLCDDQLALERHGRCERAEVDGHLDAVVQLVSQKEKQLSDTEGSANDLHVINGNMNQQGGSGHLVTPFLVEPMEPRQTVVTQRLSNCIYYIKKVIKCQYHGGAGWNRTIYQVVMSRLL